MKIKDIIIDKVSFLLIIDNLNNIADNLYHGHDDPDGAEAVCKVIDELKSFEEYYLNRADLKRTVYKQAWEKYGKNMQFVVAMEECAELIKELSKAVRGEMRIDGLCEEIGDVEIIIEQIKQNLSLSSNIETWQEIKIKELKQILDCEE
ncbi:MAG: hypothetical protein LUE64_05990 [Candidatus Gastranaerophilales bacterium]|nr:hypothetical protein [Candidatus Gastranaerophilales bacterium]